MVGSYGSVYNKSFTYAFSFERISRYFCVMSVQSVDIVRIGTRDEWPQKIDRRSIENLGDIFYQQKLWKFVDKDHLLQHIKIYDEESIFYKHKNDIEVNSIRIRMKSGVCWSTSSRIVENFRPYLSHFRYERGSIKFFGFALESWSNKVTPIVEVGGFLKVVYDFSIEFQIKTEWDYYSIIQGVGKGGIFLLYSTILTAGSAIRSSEAVLNNASISLVPKKCTCNVQIFHFWPQIWSQNYWKEI